MTLDLPGEARRLATNSIGYTDLADAQKILAFAEKVREEALAEKPQRLDSEVVCPECDALLDVTLMVATADGDVGGSYSVSEPGKTAERVEKALAEGRIAGLEEALGFNPSTAHGYKIPALIAKWKNALYARISALREGKE